MSFADLDRVLELFPEMLETLRSLKSCVLPDEVLNTKGAAQLLLIGSERVRELASVGILPGTVDGNGWTFSKRDLLCWKRLSGREGIHLRAAQIDFFTETLKPGYSSLGSTLEQLTGAV